MIEKELTSVKIFDFNIPDVPLYQIFNWLTEDDNLVIGNISVTYEPGYFDAKAYVN